MGKNRLIPKRRRVTRPSSASATFTEKQWLDTNQRLHSIFVTSEVGTWTWDLTKDIVVADKNLARMFGVTSEQAAGAKIETYFNAVHPEDRPRVNVAVQAALRNPGAKYAIDYRILRPDGTIIWVSARGNVERDANGTPTYFPGVIIDITERRASEQRAEELHRRLETQARMFDTVLSSIVDFAYIFDRQGRFSYVNKALLDLWGLPLEDAVGKDFFELKYPPELAERLQRQIQQVFAAKASVRDETPYTSPTGVVGYYEYIFSPVFDGQGDVEVVAGSTRDISARKRTEEELRRSREELKAIADTLESQVLSRTVELEERNAAVLMQSDQLRELSVRLMETQDEAGRRTARDLHDSAGQLVAALSMNMGRMVRELKNASPEILELAEANQSLAKEIENELRATSYLLHPPLLDEIGLTAALRWYVDGLKQRAGLDARLDVPENFERPHRAAELTIFRIIQECLTNIHRHSGSKTAHIRVAYEDGNIVAEVSDSGRGMSADQLATLESGGVDVGLRGMRERVRQFAGDLQVKSQPGQGTTVRVILPELYAV